MLFARKEIERLREENRDLRSQLSQEKEKTRRSAFIGTANLPECKSLACVGCEHIVVQVTPHGGYFVVGCGKNNPCGDYVKSNAPEAQKQAIRQVLQSQWQL